MLYNDLRDMHTAVETMSDEEAHTTAERRLAIKRSADRAQLDTVSYPLPIGVGCQSWSVQPSRQC
jgi:hypothetical protein